MSKQVRCVPLWGKTENYQFYFIKTLFLVFIKFILVLTRLYSQKLQLWSPLTYTQCHDTVPLTLYLVQAGVPSTSVGWEERIIIGWIFLKHLPNCSFNFSLSWHKMRFFGWMRCFKSWLNAQHFILLESFLSFLVFIWFFVYFWRASVCWPLLSLCRQFMIFEGCEFELIELP